MDRDALIVHGEVENSTVLAARVFHHESLLAKSVGEKARTFHFCKMVSCHVAEFSQKTGGHCRRI